MLIHLPKTIILRLLSSHHFFFYLREIDKTPIYILRRIAHIHIKRLCILLRYHHTFLDVPSPAPLAHPPVIRPASAPGYNYSPMANNTLPHPATPITHLQAYAVTSHS